VIPLLGIQLKECAPEYDIASCTAMLFAMLFTIFQLWKQPRCSMTDTWSSKMFYIYTMEFYLTIKNEVILVAGKCMELENIMLNKVSQAQKDKNHIFPYMWKLGL
jgi:hypothetical protein